MPEEADIDIKEDLEDIDKLTANWKKLLLLTTALIAVLAAIASLLSGNYSNLALLEKNNSVLAQNKESDQWNFYQAKGIKKNVAQGFYDQFANEKLKPDIDRYSKEQEDIMKSARDFEKQVEEANIRSEKYFEKHHQLAISVTFSQIAIAISAIGALIARKSFWYFSILLAIAGLGFLVYGYFLI